jgi:hypothetical protein
MFSYLSQTESLKSASIMTLSTPIKIILAYFAVAAALVSTVMLSSKMSASLKGSARKLQLRRPKIIRKRNDSLITKTGDGAPQLDSPKIIKMRNESLITKKTDDGALIKTEDGTATTSIVNAGKAAISGQSSTMKNP